MSNFEVVVVAGLAWIGIMSAFATYHLDQIEKLLKDIKSKIV